VLGTFERERLDQPEDTVLGRHVRRLVRRGDERVHGGDHDHAAAGFAQRRPRVLGQQERAGQQQRDDRVPTLERELVHRRDMLDARVGHHEIKAAEPFQGR
jgi:hypothetical protein